MRGAGEMCPGFPRRVAEGLALHCAGVCSGVSPSGSGLCPAGPASRVRLTAGRSYAHRNRGRGGPTGGPTGGALCLHEGFFVGGGE